MYKKYQIKNPKIKQMLISLVKHKKKIAVYDLDFCNNPKVIGMYCSDNNKLIKPYMISSIVDKEGTNMSLEELIEKILE